MFVSDGFVVKSQSVNCKQIVPGMPHECMGMVVVVVAEDTTALIDNCIAVDCII